MNELWFQRYFKRSPDPADPPPAPPKPDFAKDIDDLKKQNADLLARLDKMSKPNDPPTPPEDPGLAAKAKADRDLKEKATAEAKRVEAALRFSLGSATFLKDNEALLPKTIADIFARAEKDKYDSAIEKDSAIKSGLITEFFAVQANLDLLTPGPKTALEDFLKLTQAGKQEKAQSIFDQCFEPALEMLKRVKKAEEVGRSQHGLGNPSDVDNAYKARLLAGSRKHYLNEKGS